MFQRCQKKRNEWGYDIFKKFAKWLTFRDRQSFKNLVTSLFWSSLDSWYWWDLYKKNIISLLFLADILQKVRKNSEKMSKNAMYFCLYLTAKVVQENEAGNPCHEGLEESAPIGSFTCNPNISICIEKWEGPNSGITSFDNIGLAMLTVFQVSWKN